MRCNTKPITVVIIAAGLALASCGGDDTTDQVAADSGGSDTAPVTTTKTTAGDEMDDEATAPEAPTPDTTDLAPSTSAGPIEPDALARSPRWLASVTSEPRSADGWLVPAGDWTTAAFSSPVTFTTTSDLILVGEYADLVAFRDPTRPDEPGLLYLARAAFLNRAGTRGPVPSSPSEITELLESQDDVDLINSGTIAEGDTAWWDIVVDNFDNGAPYGCELGDRCGPIAFSEGGVAIDTLEAATTRIYRTDLGGTRIGAYVTGHEGGREQLIEVAEALVESLGREEPAEPSPARSFFGVLDAADRSIPAGTHVARFPDATLTFELDEPLDGFEIGLSMMNTIWITTPTAGLGLVPADWLIDPTADQRAMTDDGETNYVYLEPRVANDDEFLDWSTSMQGTPSLFGSETLGGLEFVVIDDAERAADRTANTRPCDPPNESSGCIVAFTSDGVPWMSEVDGDGEAPVGQTAFNADAGVVASIVALDGGTVADARAALAPLLDALTIERVDLAVD